MIEDLIGMRQNAPPPVAQDLAVVAPTVSRLSVLGSTRNLNRLSQFKSLEALWVGRAREDQLDQIVGLIAPLYLMLDSLRVADLSILRQMPTLQALEIRSNTQLSDLSFLSSMPDLRLLSVSHCPRIHDLDPIRMLRHLQILDLSGGMWSTFRPDSLQPLADLHELRGLSLKAIRVRDQSLAPLANLKQLRQLELSNQFPTREYARLSVALAETECRQFAPYLPYPSGRGGTQVLVTGTGKPVLTLPRDQGRLDLYIDQFRTMQNGFRASS